MSLKSTAVLLDKEAENDGNDRGRHVTSKSQRYLRSILTSRDSHEMRAERSWFEVEREPAC